MALDHAPLAPSNFQAPVTRTDALDDIDAASQSEDSDASDEEEAECGHVCRRMLGLMCATVSGLCVRSALCVCTVVSTAVPHTVVSVSWAGCA